MKGIILAGGLGTRLYPLTKAVSKQLLPVYDKPMIYYSLSVLMLAKIKDILIISTEQDIPNYKQLLGNGSQFNINISYCIQPKPDGLAQAFILGEEFINNEPCAMILGDNLFYGNDFIKHLKQAAFDAEYEGMATIFSYQVKNPEAFGTVVIDDKNNIIDIEEKPKYPKSNYAITGLYFYPSGVSEFAKTIQLSPRQELEITDLNKIYLKNNKLKVENLGKGFFWIDMGTIDNLLIASNFVQTIEIRQNISILNPEEIAKGAIY